MFFGVNIRKKQAFFTYIILPYGGKNSEKEYCHDVYMVEDLSIKYLEIVEG